MILQFALVCIWISAILIWPFEWNMSTQISLHEHCFVPQRSTIFNLFIYSNNIINSLEEGNNVGAACIHFLHLLNCFSCQREGSWRCRRCILFNGLNHILSIEVVFLQSRYLLLLGYCKTFMWVLFCFRCV